MNHRPLLSAVLLSSLLVLVGLTAWLLHKSPRPTVANHDDMASVAAVTSKQLPMPFQSSAVSPSARPEALPTAAALPAKDQANAWDALRQAFSHFESMGGGDAGPPFDYVARQIVGRDKVKVDRAFNELLYRRSTRDSLPVLRSYLTDADIYTRFMAAQSLLIAGDDSGVAVLTALLKTAQPIVGFDSKEDLRDSAALTLTKYHQNAALPDILNIYSKTKNPYLSQALADLGVPLPDGSDLPFYPSELALTQYAQRGTTRFLPQIRKVFEQTNKRSLKAAAAWSLATMTGDAAAKNFLVEKARSGLGKAKLEDVRDLRETIKYVGTLQTPEAKATLEAALEDPDADVIQKAIVNLLYNQSGSDLAIRKLADQLDDPSHAKLPWEFLFNVVSKFLDNPVLAATGERYAHAQRGNNEYEWRHNVLERRTWPSATWIGQYMIQLKR